MKLQHPFFISSHLAPALRIGEATLSLIGESMEDDGRTRCNFVLETPDFTYVDDKMRTGCYQETSTVQLFESFLGFMEACGESLNYGMRTGTPGDNADLFPPNIGEWIQDHLGYVSLVRSDICDEDGYPNKRLIAEE